MKVTNYEHTQAVALLTREVLCEQIYRNRAAVAGDLEHINKALQTRGVNLDAIVRHTTTEVLVMTKDKLRAHAAEVLDKIMKER